MATQTKIDIWSDVVCPFCYIGKRNLEQALLQASLADSVTIEWHSFQLDPDTQSEPGKDVYQYLAERKGQTLEWSIAAHAHVTQVAKEAGLEYRMQDAKIANTRDAHRLLQLAKKHNKGNELEELLFQAYFTDGKDIGDHQTLAAIGEAIGIDSATTLQMLHSNQFDNEVQRDIAQAAAYGIRGVPFFVINNKIGVSGAQPPSAFIDAIQQAAIV